MALVDIRKVSKTFRGTSSFGWLTGSGAHEVRALKEVSIELQKGGAHGVVGESGAGKTTLAATITGIEQPTSGEILLDGATFESTGDRREWARKVQLVWQDPMAALDPRQRVATAIAEPLLVQSMEKNKVEDRVVSLMSEVGLDEALGNRFPGELSGGQAQRVVIARALAVDPKLLVCDEPASALDAPVKAQIARLLERLREQRELAYILIAHDLPLVSRITDTVTVLYRGVVVEQGPTRAVLGSPMHPYTRLLIDCEPSSLAGKEWKKVTISDREAYAQREALCPFLQDCSRAVEHCGKEMVLLRQRGDRNVACIRPLA